MRRRRWSTILPLRLRTLFRRGRVEDDLDAELAYHVEMTMREERARGLSPADARAAALRRFGGLAVHKEACREARGLARLEALVQDVRHAARGLRRTPGYTTVAILVLGVGIGATCALLAAVDAVLIKPLPLPQVERLRWLEETRHGEASSGNPQRLRDWSTVSGLDSIAGLYSDSPVVRGLLPSERIDVMRMFGPLIQTLRLQPALGRLPTPDEARGAGEQVVLLSHRFWRDRLGARPQVLGSPLVLDGVPHVVIGVLPVEAERVFDVELWAPAPPDLQDAPRTAGFVAYVARLAPATTEPALLAALDVTARRLAATYPETDRGRAAYLTPFVMQGRSETRLPLLVLLASGGLVLLVATLNVAALSLARGAGRRREASLRVSLGAGRARLLQLHLVESALIVIGGVALGLVLAPAALDLLRAWIPAPGLALARIDGRIAAAAALLAGLCTLTVGALPALVAMRCAVAPVLREGGPSIGGLARSRWRGAIVAAEVMLAVVALVGASLLARSLTSMSRAPLGFEPAQALSFKIPLPWSGDDAAGRRVELARDVVDRARSWPGVIAAGVADRLPMGGGAETTPIAVNGMSLPPELASQWVEWRTATAGFFAAAGIPVTRGSLYQEVWRSGMPRLAVVNEAFVRRYLGGHDPLGREVASTRSTRGGSPPPWFRIVGVVGDVRSQATELDAKPRIYLPWGATGWPMLHVVVRTTAAPESLVPVVRAFAESLGADLTVEQVQTLQAHIDGLARDRRTGTTLVAGFAAVALALSMLGLYGLLAGEVAARRQELGVRLALGARPAQLVAATWRRGVRLASIGLALGLALAPLVSRSMSGLLIGVSVNDWVAPAASGALFLIAVLPVSLIPALRAARIEPVAALRHD